MTVPPSRAGGPGFVTYNGTNPPSVFFPDPPRINGDYQLVMWGSQSATETADATNDVGMTRIGVPFSAATSAARFGGIWGLGIPVDAGAPLSVQFTRTGPGARHVLASMTMRGIDLSSPVGAASTGWAVMSGSTVSIPSINVPVDNCLVFAFYSATWGAGPAATVATPPAGWTLAGTYMEPPGGTTAVSRNTVHIYQMAYGQGPSGAVAAVFTATPAAASGQLIAFRPIPDPVTGRKYPAPATVTGDVKSYGKFAEYS